MIAQPDIMTSEPNRPVPENTTLRQRLLDTLLKNPFIALWNIALVVGGLIALIYFAQVGYLPDLDLKSASSFLVAIALLGIFLGTLLILVFNVPSWMIRSEQNEDDTSPIARSFALRAFLCGVTGASFWLLIFGLFGIDPGHETLGQGIVIGSGVVLVLVVTLFGFLALKTRPVEPLRFLGRHFILLFLWLMVAPSFWMLALMRFRDRHHDDVATLLMSCVFLLIVIALNTLLAAMRLKSARSYLTYLVISLCIPALYLVMPSESRSLTTAIFSHVSLGGMTDTAFVIKEPACKGLNLLVPGACAATSDPTLGCVRPARLASRVGSEFLFVFKSGDKEIKMPVQKTDVLTWGMGVGDKACAVVKPMLPAN